MKRLITLFATLLFSATMAFAQTTFNLGDNVQGVVDGETLTISGTGNMDDFTYWTKPSFGNIKKIIIEVGVTNIGSSVFYECIGLTEVTIPNSVTSIGGYAFKDCSGLTEVTIPNSVTSIGDYAFYGCSGLTEITIPNSVTSIGEDAFSNCIGLTAVTIPNSVTNIGDGAFFGCSGLTTVTIPNSVTSIGIYAFKKCSGLTAVTIPNSVTKIGKGAFADCIVLTSVTIPNSVTSIGDEAFRGCSGLTAVTIPNSVTSIGYGAFWNCSGLTAVTIGNSVTSIGEDTFSDCIGLTLICYEGSSEPTYESDSFDDVAITIPVCVPADYSSDSWCGFTNLYKGHEHSIVNDEEIPATCTEIGITEGSHCSICGGVLTQKVIPALGHDFSEYVYNNDATTDADGTETAICSRCGEKDTRVAEGTKLGTAVTESAANAVNIYANGRNIVVENTTEEISVYDAMGKLICRDAINRVRTEIPVNTTGVYIVKVGNIAKRVVIN